MENMTITNAQYIAEMLDNVANNTGILATIDGVEAFVPLDPSNRHYAEIMRQVEAGELTIQEASE